MTQTNTKVKVNVWEKLYLLGLMIMIIWGFGTTFMVDTFNISGLLLLVDLFLVIVIICLGDVNDERT